MPAKKKYLEFDSIAALLEYQKSSLLLSQELMLQATEFDQCIASGVGSGKNVLLAMKAILLLYFIPGNEGLMGRDTATNLEATTKADFYRVLPKDLLVRRKDGKENYCDIRTRDPHRTSRLYFRHFLESRIGVKHLSGFNLGFYCGDQIEDIDEQQWDYLETRLRSVVAEGHHMKFGAANTKGKDWVYRRFFYPAIKEGKIEEHHVDGKMGKRVPIRAYRSLGRLGITSQSYENVHLPDNYIPNILQNQTREYIQRYVEASFEEWGGKIYKEFHENSVHVIEPFPIPNDWPTIVSIDVGGDSPWAVLVGRIAPRTGDIFLTNEYYEPGVLVDPIVAWMRNPILSGIPNISKARFVCDHDKLAIGEFAMRGIYCDMALKANKRGSILRVAGYMQPKPGRQYVIPHQPKPGGGRGPMLVENAPHLWVFRTLENTIREHSEWQWKRDRLTQMPQDEPEDKNNDHTCDSLLYLVRIRPAVEELPKVDPDLEKLKTLDYHSYREVMHRDRMAGRHKQPERGSNFGEMFSLEAGQTERMYPEEVEERPW